MRGLRSLREVRAMVAQVDLDAAILKLFDTGNGMLFDASVLSSLSQSSSSSVAVTANDDPVGRLGDISGLGNDAIQATSTKRPLYKTANGKHWLQPDGSDDFMLDETLVDLGETWTHVGAWFATGQRAFGTSTDGKGAPRVNVSKWRWYDDTSTMQDMFATDPATPHIFTVEQANTTTLQGRFNRVAGSVITPYDDSADNGANMFSLFASTPAGTGGFFSGGMYAGLWIDRAITTAERTIAEAWAASKL